MIKIFVILFLFFLLAWVVGSSLFGLYIRNQAYTGSSPSKANANFPVIIQDDSNVIDKAHTVQQNGTYDDKQ